MFIGCQKKMVVDECWQYLFCPNIISMMLNTSQNDKQCINIIFYIMSKKVHQCLSHEAPERESTLYETMTESFSDSFGATTIFRSHDKCLQCLILFILTISSLCSHFWVQVTRWQEYIHNNTSSGSVSPWCESRQIDRASIRLWRGCATWTAF